MPWSKRDLKLNEPYWVISLGQLTTAFNFIMESDNKDALEKHELHEQIKVDKISKK